MREKRQLGPKGCSRIIGSDVRFAKGEFRPQFRKDIRLHKGIRTARRHIKRIIRDHRRFDNDVALFGTKRHPLGILRNQARRLRVNPGARRNCQCEIEIMRHTDSRARQQ